MRIFTTIINITAFASSVKAAYTGGGGGGSGYSDDIVQYWNIALASALNAASPRLSSVNEGWASAYTHACIFNAATLAKGFSLRAQQISVSYAAYNCLSHIFVNQQSTFATAIEKVLDEIAGEKGDLDAGKRAGREAADAVQKQRLGDGVDEYVRYEFAPPKPGVYQRTPPTNSNPASPNGRYIRPFGGIKKTDPWPVPPPDPTKPGYEAQVRRIYEKGAKVGSTRTEEETEIGYFWAESSATLWNRFARIVLSRRKTSVYESAKFFAILNYGIANAGFVAWESKYTYNAWRPITAIRYPEPYLAGFPTLKLPQPDWEPLVNTPNHPDYLSGHAVYGGGASGVLKRYFRSDKIDPPVTLTSNSSVAGEITRSFDSFGKAAKENGDSRIFIGVHFQFASDEGAKAGDKAAEKVWEVLKGV